MKQHTKIICTLGPAVATREKIAQLIEAGMNVARINCSHGSWEERTQWIQWIRELSPQVGPIGILVDLQGPKFRLGTIKGDPREIQTGEILTLGQGSDTDISVPQKEIYDAIEVNDKLLIGDGEIGLLVVSQAPGHFEVKVSYGGTLKSHKGITIVGKSFSVPTLTEKDLEDLHMGATLGADYIALSYVKTADDLKQLRELINEYDSSIQICAKIENQTALSNLDDILKVTDIVMVARGDLGLQMDIETVPVAQKLIISRCSLVGRPVITATQMLESMINVPRPTRAEATDVANAILDGTDAVMLSGETAVGKYPIETVQMMAKIAQQTETIFDHLGHSQELREAMKERMSSTEAVALAVVLLASHIGAKAIVTTTTSGSTARMVSKFRPSIPILCASWNLRTQAQLAVVWGVEAIHIPLPHNTDEITSSAIQSFVDIGYLKYGEMVVVTAGVPAGVAGNTNLILTHIIKP